MRFTSINRIFNATRRLIANSLEDIDESDIIEWIGEATEHLYTHDFLEEAVCFAEVNNYQAELPTHLAYIIQVARNKNWSCSSNALAKDCFTPSQVIDDITEEQAECPVRVDCNGHFIDEVAYYRPYFSLDTDYGTWTATSFYTANYTPVRLADHSFLNTIVCNTGDESPYTNYVDEYTVVNRSHLRFNFKTGSVAIAYLRPHLDENGLPMLPDVISVIEAVTRYVIYKISEISFYNHRQGSESRLAVARDDWHWYLRQAKNDLAMEEGVDLYQNMVEQWNYMIPNFNRYSAFFGNLSRKEDTGFRDPDNRNRGFQHVLPPSLEQENHLDACPVDDETPVSTNNPPSARNVFIDGTMRLNSQNIARWAYSDIDGTPEENSVIIWYLYPSINDAINHTNFTQIALGSEFVPTGNDGQYVRVGVTPRSIDGLTGSEVLSQPELIQPIVPPGDPPIATNVRFDQFLTASPNVIEYNTNLTVLYDYTDQNQDPEGASIIQIWSYPTLADANSLSNRSLVGQGTSFTPQTLGRYIRISVTPVSATGSPAIGVEVYSPVYEVQESVLEWQTTGTGVTSWQIRVQNGQNYLVAWNGGATTAQTGNGSFQTLSNDYAGVVGTKTVRVYASSQAVITGLEWNYPNAQQTGALDIRDLDNLTNFSITGDSSLNNFTDIVEPTLLRNMERYVINQALFTAINPQDWVGDVNQPTNSTSFIIANLPNLTSLNLGTGVISNGLVSIGNLTCPISGTRAAGGAPRIFFNNNTNFYTWSGTCEYISCGNNTFAGVADLSGLTCTGYFQALNNSFSEIREPAVTGNRIDVAGNAITVYVSNPSTTGVINDFDFRNQAASAFPSLSTYNFANNANINIENNVLSQSQSDTVFGELATKAGAGPVAWTVQAGGSNTAPPTGPGSNYSNLANAGASIFI